MTITITLNKILAHSPCSEGWDAVLARTDLHGSDYDREWPLVAVLDTDRPSDAIWAMRCLPEHSRLWRLFAVRCARHVQHLMTDPRSIEALDVAERHANGLATDEELAAARAAARAAAWDAARAAAWDAAWAEQYKILRALLTEGR